MIEIKTAPITLGDKEYTLKEAPRLISKPWKKKFIEEIQPLFQELSGAPDMRFDKPEDLFQLFPLVESLLIDGSESIFELLIAYSPELIEDREYIEAHATDRQIFAAFQEVIKLADFLEMGGMMKKQIGRSLIGISSNSPRVNGASA